VNPKIALAGAAVAGAISAVCAIYNYVGGSQHEQNVIALKRKIALLDNEYSAKELILVINGREVAVGDKFLDLTPEQQNATVDHIAKSIGTVVPPKTEPYSGTILPITKSPEQLNAERIAARAELTKAQRALEAERGYSPMLWPYALSALIILITSILPWLWYFLLQRIRELSAAIRGG
jgi:hypothetical protein